MILIKENGETSIIGEENARNYGIVPDDTKPAFTSVFAVWDRYNIILIKEDQRVYVKGHNERNQLGIAWYKNYVDNLSQIKNFKAVFASCGKFHTAFLTEKGKVYVCGYNDYNQLNCPSTYGCDYPTEFYYKPNKYQYARHTAVQVLCKDNTTLIVNNKYELYIYGMYYTSVVGYVDYISGLVFNINVACVGYSGLHIVFITDQNDVYTCGLNQHAELGFEHTNIIENRIQIPQFKAKFATCAMYHTTFITMNNDVYICGYVINEEIPTNHITLTSLGIQAKSVRYSMDDLLIIIDMENSVFTYNFNREKVLEIVPNFKHYMPDKRFNKTKSARN